MVGFDKSFPFWGRPKTSAHFQSRGMYPSFHIKLKSSNERLRIELGICLKNIAKFIRTWSSSFPVTEGIDHLLELYWHVKVNFLTREFKSPGEV